MSIKNKKVIGSNYISAYMLIKVLNLIKFKVYLFLLSIIT
jgi:hypothetical protein